METSSGKLQNIVIPAGKEYIEAMLTSSNECGPVTITATSGNQKAEVQVNFTYKESGIDVVITPADIPADSKSTSNVNINIKDDNKPIDRTILEILAIAFTIAGGVWAIIYAVLNEGGYSMALRTSLEIFGFFFLLILIIYSQKK